ncbi:MAG TPA: DNA adenine methylase [Dehalococcoidia bacterium]|nr:DNA adenine methylase [Dehalococcoidia bacterium]
MTPFVKWAGGKGQLLAQLDPYFPPHFRKYLEPFVGGGAVFFHLQPKRAVLGDSNEELITCYRVIRNSPEELIASLEQHRYESDYFYEVRARDPRQLTDVERASRFIFLNKTCYNGLYRVNRRGQFNVPFGRYATPPRIFDPSNILGVSRLLQTSDLVCASYEQTIQRAEPGDFVYFDPPYHPLSATANFTRYTQLAFTDFDQFWLAQAFRTLTERGVYVMLNNSDTPLVRWLYKAHRIVEARANRAINSDPAKRNPVVELIITNY